MAETPIHRIFFSSPGDVKLERETARRIVERLQAELGARARLEPYFWEHEALVATRDYQENIPPMDGFDVVVCILWSRLGSPLDPRRHPRPDGGFFESGTEYEFATALDAHRARGTPELLVFRNRTEPRRPSRPKEAREAVDREIDRLDEFFARYFREGDYYTCAVNSYRTLGEFEDKLAAGLRALLERHLPAPGASSPRRRASYAGRPYLGLSAFDFADAPVFCGRTAQVGEVIAAFQTQELEARAGGEEGRRFVLVLGASGSGKSSLARAGVLPLLVQPGVIEGTAAWRRAILRPGEAEGDPFRALAGALLAPEALPELGSDGTDATALAGLLRRQAGGAGLLLRQALSQAGVQARHVEELRLREELRKLESDQRDEDARELKERLARLAPPPVRLALLCDQLEELFTADLPADVRAAFVECLASLARSGRCFVLATLRSDFYPRCLEHPVLIELMRGNGSHALAAPGPAELGQMIRQPAEVAGLAFERESSSGVALDELLRDAALKDPAALPLLSYTLEQLHERRSDDGLLTLAAYRELGGLEGAIGKRAEAVFTALAPEAQGAFDGVWRQLVTLGEGGAPVRRHALASALAAGPGASALVEALVKARLLVADRTTDGERSISVAHEALLRHWPRVTAWVEANREFLRARSRLATRFAEWNERGRSDDYLVPAGPALAEAEGLLDAHGQALEAAEADYVRRSAARARARELARLRRSRMITTGAVTLSVLALIGGAIAWHERGIAEEQRATADKNEKRAIAQERVALEQKEAAERLAREAHASQTRAAYLLGLEMLEAGKTREGLASLAQTLVLDPAHAGARDRLYTYHLYGLPKAICLLSVEGPEGVRQRISGAGAGPEQRIAYLDARGQPVVFDLDARAVVPGPWSEESDLLAGVLERTGRHLLCVRKNSSFRIWSLLEGTASAVLTPSAGWSTVDFSEDGRWFAAAWYDGTVRVWGLPDGRLAHEWQLGAPVGKFAFDSAHGRLVYAGDALVAFDLASGEERARVLDPAWVFRDLRLSASGATWAVLQLPRPETVAQTRFARFSSDDFAERPGAHEFDGTVFDFSVSEDGEELAVASFSSEATVFSRAQGESPSRFLHATYPTLARFTPDARHVITATSDGTVRIFDEQTRTLAFEPIHGEGRLEDLEVSWDGRYLLTSTARRARVWDLSVGRALTQPLAERGRTLSCAFTRDGRTLWTASGLSGLQGWDAHALQPSGSALFAGDTFDCLFDDAGGRAALELASQQLALVDLERGAVLGEPWTMPEARADWAFGAHGKQLAVVCGRTVHFLSTQDGQPAGEPWTLTADIMGFAFDPAGERVAVLTLTEVRLLELATRRETVLDAAGMNVRTLRFGPDGRYLAGLAVGRGMSVENAVLLWEPARADARARQLAHGDLLTTLAFSPDGRWLATGTRGQIAQVWDVERGVAACDPIFHAENIVQGVLFGPDGTRLATSCGDGKVRVFDWREARAVSPAFDWDQWEGSSDFSLSGWAFSPDGACLALSAPDHEDPGLGFTRVHELAPPVGREFDLVALTEAASALRVSATGAPLAVDPYEGWQRLAAAGTARWFFEAPAQRSISPAFTAPSSSWIQDKNVNIAQTVSAMPAVGMVRAALSAWRQAALATSKERSATLAEGSKEQQEELATQAELEREIAELVEFAARGAARDPSVCLWLGMQASTAGDEARALEWFERGLALEPDERKLLMQAANSQKVLGDHAAARVRLERLCALEPDDVDYRTGLGFVRWKLGDLEGARADFAAVSERPELDPIVRVRMLVCLGRVEEAVEAWTAAAEVEEAVQGDIESLLLLVAGLFRVGEVERATTVYASLIEGDADYADEEQLRGLGLYVDIADTLVEVMKATLAHRPELAPK